MMTSIFGNTHFDFVTELDRCPAGRGNGAGDTLFRLREGLERFLIMDINSPSASVYALDHPGAGPGRVGGLEVKEYYVGNGDSRPIERCGVC